MFNKTSAVDRYHHVSMAVSAMKDGIGQFVTVQRHHLQDQPAAEIRQRLHSTEVNI